MNSIMVISPYKFKGQWVFDDADKGLKREAFVAGADTIIDAMTEDIKNAAKGFNMLFSATPFPGYQVKVQRIGYEYGGTIYACPELEMVGWLCPALLKYFTEAPEFIYAQVKQIKSPTLRRRLARRFQ